MTKLIGAYWESCPTAHVTWRNLRPETLLIDPYGQGIQGAIQIKSGCVMEVAVADLVKHPGLLRWLRYYEGMGVLEQIDADVVH
jgi:hypothetical protein